MLSTSALPASTWQRFPELSATHGKKKSPSQVQLFALMTVSMATKRQGLSNYLPSDGRKRGKGC